MNSVDLQKIGEHLLQIGLKNTQGISDEDIKDAFPQLNISEIAHLINDLSSKGLIQILKQGTCLVYKFLPPSEVSILSSLASEERIIYQYIKTADNRGIWIKDLKMKTNLHQNVLTKILKTLESRKLIKSVKSVKSSTKKVYMLYDIEPSADVTGGPWFSDNELDSEFIEGLSKAAYKFIASKSTSGNNGVFPVGYSGYATLEQVHRFIMDSGVSNVDLTAEDISNVIDVLVYGGKVEKVYSSGMIVSEDGDLDFMYKIVRSYQAINGLSEIPCSNCPV